MAMVVWPRVVYSEVVRVGALPALQGGAVHVKWQGSMHHHSDVTLAHPYMPHNLVHSSKHSPYATDMGHTPGGCIGNMALSSTVNMLLCFCVHTA